MSKETQKNLGGRPPIIKTADEMDDKIKSYIADCQIREAKPNLPMLAHWLGFESKQSLYDYEKKPEFSYLLKRVRLILEASHLDSGKTMDIFVLKNHYGYVDKTEVDNKHNFSSMDDNELDSRIRELTNAIK